MIRPFDLLVLNALRYFKTLSLLTMKSVCGKLKTL
ncbi:hypothetical protein CLOLEP_02431 [[Clostridium] leptum DSM 753]|uniref:Uncharacterized protein n=1 Tax=[Clostridium] leptum DSM 753 TaxID=428125 RepID=A7VV26_9FIRM|nr:hypothetical protein CLOLEP_02431 [[Clostridium] leptum DSM 753]